MLCASLALCRPVVEPPLLLATQIQITGSSLLLPTDAIAKLVSGPGLGALETRGFI
jgi:hypothetical protein